MSYVAWLLLRQTNLDPRRNDITVFRCFQVPVPPPAHRVGRQPGPDGAPDQNLVPEPPDEGQEGQARHRRQRRRVCQRLSHLDDGGPPGARAAAAADVPLLADGGGGGRRLSHDAGATAGPFENAQENGRGAEVDFCPAFVTFVTIGDT